MWFKILCHQVADRIEREQMIDGMIMSWHLEGREIGRKKLEDTKAQRLELMEKACQVFIVLCVPRQEHDAPASCTAPIPDASECCHTQQVGLCPQCSPPPPPARLVAQLPGSVPRPWSGKRRPGRNSQPLPKLGASSSKAKPSPDATAEARETVAASDKGKSTGASSKYFLRPPSAKSRTLKTSEEMLMQVRCPIRLPSLLLLRSLIYLGTEPPTSPRYLPPHEWQGTIKLILCIRSAIDFSSAN